MDRSSKNTCEIAPARRGQIIQRVLVDGWSAAQAAAAFGVSERRVVRWVAAYRRLGMASLRDGTMAERAAGGRLLWLRAWLARLTAAVRRAFGTDLRSYVELRRSWDDGLRRR